MEKVNEWRDGAKFKKRGIKYNMSDTMKRKIKSDVLTLWGCKNWVMWGIMGFVWHWPLSLIFLNKLFEAGYSLNFEYAKNHKIYHSIYHEDLTNTSIHTYSKYKSIVSSNTFPVVSTRCSKHQIVIVLCECGRQTLLAWTKPLVSSVSPVTEHPVPSIFFQGFINRQVLT